MNKKQISAEQIINLLDVCYGKAIHGIPHTKDCHQMATEYMKNAANPEEAAKKFMKWQIAKCTTSGALTSIGGMTTLPVAIPANLATVWYVQLRMIATLAVMGGYDPAEDSVQTLAYICLAGTSVTKICKEAGVQFANKLTMTMIKKIPGAVLTKLNQKIGFRFVTKFGTTGIVNLGKAIPVVGGIIGGSIDFVETKIIAQKAYTLFLLNKID